MKCTRCQGSGFVYTENPTTKELEASPCQCRLERDKQLTEEHYKHKFLEAGISSVFWNLTFDGYRKLAIGESAMRQANSGVVKVLEDFVNTPESFINNYNTLWLWSSLGNAGCTSLAIILAMGLIRKNYNVRFVTMQNLLNAFVEFDDKKVYFKDLDHAQFYVLDNTFVAGRCSIRGEYTAVQLYNWLNEALLKDKRFICTSRVELSKVDKVYEHSAGVLKKRVLSQELQGTLAY